MGAQRKRTRERERVSAAALAGCVACAALALFAADAHAQSGVVLAQPVQVTEDPQAISAPEVLRPLVECAGVVRVAGALPGARVEVLVDGVLHAAHAPMEGGDAEVAVPALGAGAEVRARQEHAATGQISAWSPVLVADDPSLHVATGPTGAPEFAKARLAPQPLYECSETVSVLRAVPGATATIEERPSGSAQPTVLAVARDPSSPSARPAALSRPLAQGEYVQARYELCGDVAAPLPEDAVRVLAEPAQIPAPRLGALYEGMSAARVIDALPGSSAEVFVGPVGQRLLVGSAPVSRARVGVAALSRELNAGEVVSARLSLCSPSAHSAGVTVQACSALGAPVLGDPEIGATRVAVLAAAQGSVVQVFDVSGHELGEGSGSSVGLYRALSASDFPLTARQSVGSCTGQAFYELPRPACSVTEGALDPALAQRAEYGVGVEDYDAAPVVIGGATVPVRAHVRYPSEPGTSGRSAPAPGHGGRFPLVLIMHGEHGTWRDPVAHAAGLEGDNGEAAQADLCPRDDLEEPLDEPVIREYGAWTEPVDSHMGYTYLQDALAKRGYVTVSIDATDLDCGAARGIEQHEARAELFEAHARVAHELDWGHPSAPPVLHDFYARIDTQSAALIGHGVAGEGAALLAKRAGQWWSPSWRAVLALSPNNLFASGYPRSPHAPWPDPSSAALLVVSPAAAGMGDAHTAYTLGAGAPGISLYDRARGRAGDPTWYKALWHARGFRHNLFNREWAFDDDAAATPSQPTRADHERALVAWSLALLGDRLRALPEAGARAILSGDARAPAGVFPVSAVSYERSGAVYLADFDSGGSLTTPAGLPIAPSGFQVFAEEWLRPLLNVGGGGPYSTSYHDTWGLLAEWSSPSAGFYVDLGGLDASGKEYLSIRAQAVDGHPLNPQAWPGASAKVPVRLESHASGGVGAEGALIELPDTGAHALFPKDVLHTTRVPLKCIAGQHYGQPSASGADLSSLDRAVFYLGRAWGSGALFIDDIVVTD